MFITIRKNGIQKGAVMKVSHSITSRWLTWSFCWLSSAWMLAQTPVATQLAPDANTPVYKVYGKETTLDAVQLKNRSAFFELEQKKYQLIENEATNAYLEAFWTQKAKEKNQTVEQYREAYFSQHVKISDKEVKATLEKFKDHPQLSKLPPKEQETQVREYLKDRESRAMMQTIIEAGTKNGELVISMKKPEEPLHEFTLSEKDHLRYGPLTSDTKPAKCERDKCPIQIYEYSDFECPFCSRIMPDVKKILEEYKGQVVWITRDFPLSFHQRAKPAAIAAKCASYQGKYWDMYGELFNNQQNLSDADLEKYAKNIKLDMTQFQACQKSPKMAEERIAENTQTAAQNDVTGTPTIFINGRRFSGAVPYGEFKKVIDEELAKKRKT
jgi:protein-disulfide isomerase